VIEAAGLGYEIQVPLSTYEAMGTGAAAAKEEGDVRLLLQLVVRETEWRLFGFATVGERAVFRALLRVNGVGPTLALSLLSGLAPGEFRAAVVDGDVRALTQVKGVGKKTAERIVVELKDVVEKELGDVEAVQGPKIPQVHEEIVGNAVRALMALGLPATEARRRVQAHLDDAARDEEDQPILSDLVRQALRG
jgi:Holliday junction DNA helicase RuvA